jgi:broad specificity phosphatase PhoE
MKTLAFVRHAESVANLGNQLAGQSDVPLSDKGRVDAAQLAARVLAEAQFDRLFSSPLVRAVQTAEPFAALSGLPVVTDPALMEQHIGVFTGWTYPEAEHDPRYEQDRTKRWDWAPPGGGESYRAMAERIRPFFARIDALPDGCRVLCFTHAVTLRLIVGLLENTLPVYPTTLARNGELLAVEYQGLGIPHKVTTRYWGSQVEGKA